eukprot:822718-Rhodomonas_salina.1
MSGTDLGCLPLGGRGGRSSVVVYPGRLPYLPTPPIRPIYLRHRYALSACATSTNAATVLSAYATDTDTRAVLCTHAMDTDARFAVLSYATDTDSRY